MRCAPLGVIGLQPRQSLASAGLAARHPELVADESPTAAVQNRRAAHPACPVLHPAARRKLLDTAPVPADRGPYRAARVAPDLIVARTRMRECEEQGRTSGCL